MIALVFLKYQILYKILIKSILNSNISYNKKNLDLRYIEIILKVDLADSFLFYVR